jgi:hypothetical protein
MNKARVSRRSMKSRGALLLALVMLASCVSSSVPALAQSGSYYPVNETGSTFGFVFNGIPMIRQGVDLYVTREPSDPNPVPKVVYLDYYSIPWCGMPYRAHVLTYVSWGLDLPHGTQVGTLVFDFAYAPALELPLVVGHNTAEWSYDRPEAAPCLLPNSKIRDREAFNWPTNQDSDSTYTAHNYYCAVDLPGNDILISIELRANPSATEVANGAPCSTPNKYNVGLSGVTLEGNPGATPATSTSWGRIKSLYR